ncbi:vacuolar-sorting protein BRO1-like isoform X1 [Carex rostrata]
MAFTSSQAMPMLSVPEKKTSFLDLQKFLFDHISSNFSSHDASASERELKHVRQMRSDLEKQRNPSSSSASFHLDLLLQYYRAICVIERRLDCVNSIPFTWQDAFRSNKKSSLQSIDFEKAAILFNIGAVYSQIGCMTERNTEEGRKAAYVEFQKAAGVFRLLKENAVVGATVDLTAECAGMLEILMLAQAQECMFDKAIADSKGVTLCSKVAKQAGNFYIEAYSALTLPPLDQHFDRAWISHVQLKTAYFYAEAVSLYCIDLHLNEDIGQEIARLKLSISSLSDVKKSAKGAPSSLLEAASKLETKMKQNLETAVKENNQIYLMQITPVNSLSELPAAVLAQPAPVEGLDMSNETLFSNLISESNKKALTKYTEMIDDVLQSQLDKIKLAKDVCKGKLQEMGLPDSIVAVETDCTIPAELKAQVEAIQDRDGSGGLQVLLRQLMDLRKVNLELTEQMEEMLQNEEKEDCQYRDQYKEKWNRPESGVLAKEIRDMLSKYTENLREAGVSDLKIEQSMSENFGILVILDIQLIESTLPSLPWPVTYVDGSEDRTLSTLKLSLTKLETLEAKLKSLEENLKELKKQKDDILPKLLGGASLEKVLEEEREKFNPICEEISKHIEMVEQLLLEIQAQNIEFVTQFRLVEYKISFAQNLEQIRTAVAKFGEIKENLSEGIKFYASLQEVLNKLKQQSSDFVMTRDIQCQEMVEILKKPGWRIFGR